MQFCKIIITPITILDEKQPAGEHGMKIEMQVGAFQKSHTF